MIRIAIISLSLLLCLPAAAQDEERLRQAIDGEHRSPADRGRDNYRHPFETLSFFGIEPDDRVVEIYPGDGWYTAILAPYLQEEGELVVAHYPRGEEPSGFVDDPNARFSDRMREHPGVFRGIENIVVPPGEQVELDEAGSVDVIFDARNAHNWLRQGREALLQSWYEALKPGGTVAIVAHRMDPEREEEGGYIHESRLIEVMEEHGFRFVESSEINANPEDTKDYPFGVWSLPPTLYNVPDNERINYLRIGESDRMTMKFVKD